MSSATLDTSHKSAPKSTKRVHRTPHGKLVSRLVRPARGDEPWRDALELVRRDSGDERAAETLVRQLVEAATERSIETNELDGVIRELSSPVARRTLAVYLIIAEMARNGIAHSKVLWHQHIARRVGVRDVSSVERSIRALVASGVMKKWHVKNRTSKGVSRSKAGHAYAHYQLFFMPRALVRAVRDFWARRHAPTARPEALQHAPARAAGPPARLEAVNAFRALAGLETLA